MNGRLGGRCGHPSTVSRWLFFFKDRRPALSSSRQVRKPPRASCTSHCVVGEIWLVSVPSAGCSRALQISMAAVQGCDTPLCTGSRTPTTVTHEALVTGSAPHRWQQACFTRTDPAGHPASAVSTTVLGSRRRRPQSAVRQLEHSTSANYRTQSQTGFVREFRHQMSPSFGASRISPFSMFASLGTTTVGRAEPAVDQHPAYAP